MGEDRSGKRDQHGALQVRQPHGLQTVAELIEMWLRLSGERKVIKH